MIIKDIICPICGRPDISSPLKKETNYISFEEDKLININFNQNLNNISSITSDPKYQYNSIEKNNINDNSIYSIENFIFLLLKQKKKQTLIKKLKEKCIIIIKKL